MRNYPHLGIQIPDILLPKEEIAPEQWAVIAVDQYTSQPEYWQKVAGTVENQPSTYHLILPEVMLGTEDEPKRIQAVQQTMQEYMDRELFDTYEGMVYVERTIGNRTRRGLVVALDLEQYDYNKGAQTLIRATEGTILDRLPPRMKIRRGAPLELPHILVLVDDPDGAVVEVAHVNVGRLESLYDFDLMMDGGHLRGYLVNDRSVEEEIIHGFEKLANPEAFEKKYGMTTKQTGLLLYAVGDGNHSLATAKAIWEEMKPKVGMDHPARYALVEIENVHDEALEFEPIHRVLFDVKTDPIAALKNRLEAEYTSVPSRFEMVALVAEQPAPGQTIGVITSEEYGVLTIPNPSHNLPVGSLQSFLDQFLKEGGASKIDYVHGEDVCCELGSRPGHIGFYLPAMNKSDLFKTVILDGALPRKTFSMGEANEKRYYMEARRIA